MDKISRKYFTAPRCTMVVGLFRLILKQYMIKPQMSMPNLSLMVVRDDTHFNRTRTLEKSHNLVLTELNKA